MKCIPAIATRGDRMANTTRPAMDKKETKPVPSRLLSVDAASVAAYYSLAPGSPTEPSEGMRFAPSFDGGEGFRELIEIRPGFQVLLGDLRYGTGVEFALRETASLKFHYRLSGASDLHLLDDGLIHIEQHTGGVLLHPDGFLEHESYPPGAHEKSVTLILSTDYLESRLKPLLGRLPQTIADYIAGKPATLFSQHVPLRANMAAAASAMFAATGPMRQMIIEARSLELLALSIDALLVPDADSERVERGMSSRDRHCLQEARRLLEQNFVAPPTITALARTVGVNEAKLMHVFKQLFGQTIFDYTQALRMEKAKQLLETTDLSITEIAFEVGYEYSSNFTTAFKRHFSITPSTAREAARG